MMWYADVVVDIPWEIESLTYSIPSSMQSAKRGCRVEVQIQSRKRIGIIQKVHCNEPSFPAKPLLRLLDKDPILTEEQWAIADWMRKTYVAGLGECVFRMIPQGRRLIRSDSPPPDTYTDFKNLNSLQEQAYRKISDGLGKRHSVHLLYGITGSGKTEIYIHLIRDIINHSDKSVIFLVPEISLTYHIIQKLEKNFPKYLALIHSALRTSERFRFYQSLLKGEKRIVVGTRSAVFTPVQNLGLIIIDEEHDSSYKENSNPRYNAKQIAYFRARESEAVMLLGSATPSIETFYLAKTGRIHLHEIRERAVSKAELPEVRIVHKKEEEGVVGFELMQALKAQKKKSEQSILLLNRRGYSPLIYSRDKKEFIGCPNCSTNLCYHKSGYAQCHICGYRESIEKIQKEHEKIDFFGSGTQKLEEFLVMNLPDVKVERLDQDSSQNPEILNGILSRLYENELDILTGTQMIAKGLDVPNVTLVGVINANHGLGVPDFRASERVFSLLTQVAGRAGRSEKKGKVIIEATDPSHPILLLAMNQDYESFYEKEIASRRELELPPFTKLLRLMIRATDEEISKREINWIHEMIDRNVFPDLKVLGPSPCPFYRVEKYYRNHILIKAKSHESTRKLVEHIRKSWKQSRNVYLEVDFDPIEIV